MLGCDPPAWTAAPAPLRARTERESLEEPSAKAASTATALTPDLHTRAGAVLDRPSGSLADQNLLIAGRSNVRLPLHFNVAFFSLQKM